MSRDVKKELEQYIDAMKIFQEGTEKLVNCMKNFIESGESEKGKLDLMKFLVGSAAPYLSLIVKMKFEMSGIKFVCERILNNEEYKNWETLNEEQKKTYLTYLSLMINIPNIIRQ